MYDGRLEIKLGSSVDMEYKLTYLKAVIDHESSLSHVLPSSILVSADTALLLSSGFAELVSSGFDDSSCDFCIYLCAYSAHRLFCILFLI